MKNNLTEYFRKTVNDFPNKIAIDDNQVAMSFAELNKISDQIALKIISEIKSVKQPIAVYLPKHSWSIASFIGVFKSGNFYIPLDLKSPCERILKIIETLNSSWIITNFEYKENLTRLGHQGKIFLMNKLLFKRIIDILASVCIY